MRKMVLLQGPSDDVLAIDPAVVVAIYTGKTPGYVCLATSGADGDGWQVKGTVRTVAEKLDITLAERP